MTETTPVETRVANSKELRQQQIRHYALVTFNYWNFTLTDGALRMLVVLHFYSLGYSGLEIAMLFLFYEFFGVVTNLIGGWLGARIGLNRTMNIGLFMQIIALLMLSAPSGFLSIPLVMFAQAISGIAKDLNKMSAKTSIKSLVSSQQSGRLYRWIAILTGSKNALKGAGFFLGGALLSLVGFQSALLIMAIMLALVLAGSLIWLQKDLGKARSKPKFTQIFSKSKAINILSAARLFLFASRDVWFVIALPVSLSSVFGWSHMETGSFMALWVIGYGLVQGIAPKITGAESHHTQSRAPLALWSATLLLVSVLLALAITFQWYPQSSLIIGLLIFGGIFAINSSLHSYLIVSFAREEGASMDVGFYYMANAMGRLTGTVLSGWAFQWGGLQACLWISSLFIMLTAIISLAMPDS
ncbi:organoarsenical effux MFS transporter ArsJ [Endozoicomonas sp. SCSIO W0465]|uniref:organoarsenical effux MFS transporter ArsJ n=1 Tax=Endozoicomonas sp. SCSIO W0465 TaxID=2918516 RepID=UPI002075ADBF|nr:organoarsenical effux MFS transporter ArsJ [Endozoicomonas sp. SCSIO W0465]USE34734.1 organoarsenical effux MFS transporter ArsJ [Endozoicomonas sp. SCSIO W0465]